MAKDAHYCKTPLVGWAGREHKCKCGRTFKWQEPSGTFRRGHWLQVGDPK